MLFATSSLVALVSYSFLCYLQPVVLLHLYHSRGFRALAGGGALALLAAFVMFRRRSATGKEARAGAGGGTAGAEAAHESLLDSPRHRPADAGVFDTDAAVVEVPPLYPNTYVPPVLPDLQSEIAEDELAAQEQAAMIRQRAQEQRVAAEAAAAPSTSAMMAGGMQPDQQARGKEDVEERLPVASAASHVPSGLDSASALSVGPAQVDAQGIRDLDAFSSAGLESTAARVTALADASESTDKPADAMLGTGDQTKPLSERMGQALDAHAQPPEVTAATQAAVPAAGLASTQPVVGLEELREPLINGSQDALQSQPIAAAQTVDGSVPVVGLEEFTGSMADRLNAAAARLGDEANDREAQRQDQDTAAAPSMDSSVPVVGLEEFTGPMADRLNAAAARLDDEATDREAQRQDRDTAPALDTNAAPALQEITTRPPHGEILEEITEARREPDEVPAASPPALANEGSGTQEGASEAPKTSWLARIFGKRQASSPKKSEDDQPVLQATLADAASTPLRVGTQLPAKIL